jgi:hypothetical protein
MCFHPNTLRKGQLAGAIPSRIRILNWVGWKAFAVLQRRGCAAQRITTAWDLPRDKPAAAAFSS